jgi:hypothetical protein
MQLAISALVLKAETAPVVIPGARPSTSTEPVLDTGPAVPENAALQFLRGRLATRDGYAAFTSHRGRTVPNPDIVQDWQFAVDFKRDYNKLKTPTVCLCSADKYITNLNCRTSRQATFKRPSGFSLPG